jgi:L-alanine-DL-glutamate epimerase-like enolase superfamily enzyme
MSEADTDGGAALKIGAVHVEVRRLPLEESRAISREVTSMADVLVAEVQSGAIVGRGEASPSPRYRESLETMQRDIGAASKALLKLTRRPQLSQIMRPGAARNAVDAALWDLEAKLSGRPAEATAGLVPTRPATTCYTIPIKPPEQAYEVAVRERARPLIKVKLGHFDDDRSRLEAIRRGAPDATLIVDANEGWSLEQLQAMAPVAQGAGVKLIEQPLPRDLDGGLTGIDFGIPLCADESCHTVADLPAVAQRYQFINIKLDKSGGLTEALALATSAWKRKLGLMVGCTHGTTLGLAPAFLIAQLCAYCDLDAALFLAERESRELAYDGSSVDWSATRRWGLPRKEQR